MSAYSDKVIADGATAYWRLGETSGTTANSLVGSYPGTISGGVTLNQPGALADGDAAMAFVSGGYIALGVSAILSGWKTFECWFKTSVGVNGATNYTIYDDRYGALNGRIVRINGDTGVISLVTYASGAFAGVALTTRSGLYDLQWHQLVVTNVGTSCSIYLDGVLDASGAITLAAASASSDGPRIDSPTQSFIGSLDDVAIYPTALTATQIADHYAASRLPAAGTAVPYASISLPSARVPHGQWLPLMPSDITDSPFSALWVGGAGTIAAVGLDGRVVNFVGAQAGTKLRITGRRVNDTNTTATNLLALGRV